jgi:hypothetical protein
MILCNEKCQLYNRCSCKNLRQQCIFDMGVFFKEEDDDEKYEKLTY